MQVAVVKNSNTYSSKETFEYFLHFTIKALFISLLSIVIIISSLFIYVVGDSIYNMKKGNNVVPLLGGYIIVTPSMVPTIKIKDAVVVKRTNKSDLSIGDIITFKSTDERYKDLVVTHRVVGTQTISTGDLVYRTKGDNNRVEDSAVVEENNIYGKVVLKLPKLGYIKDFISTPLGFFLFIAVPILALAYINIKNLRENVEEEM